MLLRATEAGESLSRFLIKSGLKDGNESIKDLNSQNVILSDLLKQVKKLGTNINQIAKRMNANRENTIGSEEIMLLEEVRKEILDTRAHLVRMR